jgi:hypothetical protein
MQLEHDGDFDGEEFIGLTGKSATRAGSVAGGRNARFAPILFIISLLLNAGSIAHARYFSGD